MKKIGLLVFLISSFTAAFAAIITVRVANFQFSPKRVNAVVGDQIRWLWVNGSHTTTSDQIPTGATAWSRNINTNNRTFTYTLTRTGAYRYHCIPHQSAGMTGVIRVTASLSAGLTDFSVDLSETEKATINWKTRSEKDIAYYSVQRSTDGENFTEITKLEPAGSSAALQSYRYIDNNLSNGNEYMYYQLEMVDKKGNSQLSEIKMVAQKVKTARLITSLSPNPINRPGHLMVQFNADKEGTMLVQLYNESGALVKQTEMTAGKGLNNGHFHLGDLTPGIYYIVCTLGTIKEKHTIIIK